MKRRIVFLRQQAEEFRRQARLIHDDVLAAELLDLAARCNDVAARIEQNLPIHSRP